MSLRESPLIRERSILIERTLVAVRSLDELQEVQRAKGREGLVARVRDGDGPDARTPMLE